MILSAQINIYCSNMGVSVFYIHILVFVCLSSVFVMVFPPIFSSPELKAQVSFSNHPLSDICLSVNFYIFDFLSKTKGPILTRLGTNHPVGEGIQVCSIAEE
jgi:hypothetical protein